MFFLCIQDPIKDHILCLVIDSLQTVLLQNSLLFIFHNIDKFEESRLVILQAGFMWLFPHVQIENEHVWQENYVSYVRIVIFKNYFYFTFHLGSNLTEIPKVEMEGAPKRQLPETTSVYILTYMPLYFFSFIQNKNGILFYIIFG